MPMVIMMFECNAMGLAISLGSQLNLYLRAKQEKLQEDFVHLEVLPWQDVGLLSRVFPWQGHPLAELVRLSGCQVIFRLCELARVFLNFPYVSTPNLRILVESLEPSLNCLKAMNCS